VNKTEPHEITVPLLDLGPHHAGLMPELREVFEQVVSSGQFILGPFVERFEQSFAEFCQARHCISVGSGTDAMMTSLMGLGIGPGDEVITTPFTFFSLAGCIARVGATPVFIDINPRTYNLQVESIEGAITEQTKAIAAVHQYGLPANMTPIREIADRHGLNVIEDAAYAAGGKYEGRMAGTLGDVATFSFYPNKNLPSMGDAGAVVTDDDDLALKIRQLREHGRGNQADYQMIGGNFRMDALQAAVLSVKLPRLGGWVTRRRELADRYAHHFERFPIGVPFEAEHRYHAFNQYTVRVHGGVGARDALAEHLRAIGVGNRVYWPRPLHLQPVFYHLGYKRGSLPVAEQAADEVLSLPIYPEMTTAQQDKVIQGVRDFCNVE